MVYSIAEHFSRVHGGFEGLIKLTELVNSGNDLYYIATQLDLSSSQVCRLRGALFEQTWTPKRGLIEYIEFQQHCLEREISRRGEFLKEKVKLKFVAGGLDNEQSNH
jgi:hypothetical protein